MLKRTISTAAALVFLWVSGTAQAAEIRVLCSNGVRAVLEDLKPRFEKSSGHKLAIQFSSTATLKERIQGGDRKSTRLNSSHIQKSRMPSSA